MTNENRYYLYSLIGCITASFMFIMFTVAVYIFVDADKVIFMY